MIGLLPCAGQATRIHGLPKYLLPVGDTYLLDWHVKSMQAAGCREVRIGTSPENDDLIFVYGNGAYAYIAEQRETMTQTVLSYLRWSTTPNIVNDTILFGMPDTYWTSINAYQALANWMPQYEADVVVAVFRARPGQHTQGGMVRFDALHRITEVIDKPAETDFEHIWGAMAWKPAFWEYLQPDDPHVGYAIPRAIAAGLDVRAVVCEGDFWDCGTPERYFEMIRAITS